MENILDILPVGVFIIDANFHVADVNSSLEDFFGIQKNALLGKDKKKLVQERIFKIFENGDGFRKRVLATYNDNTYIERFICHILPGENRQERWLEHSSQPIQHGSFKGGRIEIYTDVTERVLAEQEIKWIATQSTQLQEKEMARIASNLHDGLGQSILAIRFTLEHLHDSLKNNPATAERDIQELRKSISWVEDMGDEIRNISSELMPSMLGPFGLDATLAWLKDQYASLYNLNIQYQSFGLRDKRPPENLEVAIFRVFQEGLNNIVKHASAQCVDLKMVYSHPKIIITITDDGKGFDPENQNDLGIGLRLMKRRVLELNGTLKITSENHRGTTIRAEFPAPELNNEKN